MRGRTRAADVCWLPGGYPELHAAGSLPMTASAQGCEPLRETGRVHGECGGYMVLGAGLTDADGTRHEMAGLLGLETSFAKRRMHLGYRLAELAAPMPGHAPGTQLRGHEFHYAAIVAQPDAPLAAVRDATGAGRGRDRLAPRPRHRYILSPDRGGDVSGFVSFVSAGPGDPDLLTLKALARLRDADVVLYDDLASGAILDHARPGAKLVAVGQARRAALGQAGACQPPAGRLCGDGRPRGAAEIGRCRNFRPARGGDRGAARGGHRLRDHSRRHLGLRRRRATAGAFP